MNIEIWSDYSCPFCYIGKVTLDQALESLGLTDKVNILYKAYQLDPHAPKIATSTAVESLAMKYQVTKQDAQAMLDSVSHKAKAIGLQFNYDILQATSTLEAHRLTRLVPKPIQAQLNQALYKAYFTQGLNLADTATLIKLSHDLGVDALEVEQQLNSNQGLKEVLEELQQAKQLGIKGVPYYRINQHTVINGAQPLQSFIEILKEAYLKEVQKYNRE